MGYAHRDIKPANVLLDAKGHVKVPPPARRVVQHSLSRCNVQNAAGED